MSSFICSHVKNKCYVVCDTVALINVKVLIFS